MGDVYGVIEVALSTLGPLVTEEVSLLSGLKDDVTSIRNELLNISAFLKKSEEEGEGDVFAKEWTRQLRMLAYEIEDVIERYQLFAKSSRLSKATQYLTLEVHGMATTIKRLRETAKNLAEEKNRYSNGGDNVNNNSNNNNNNNEDHGKGGGPGGRLTTSYHQSMDYVDVDGVQDDIAKGEVIELLDLQEFDSDASTVVVVGMGGLGKTTVVDSVYHDKTVRSNFSLFAWIRVQKCKTNIDILRSLIYDFEEVVPNLVELTSLHKSVLLKRLQSLLKDKRYMVVFDDVQEDDTDLAAYVRRVFLPYSDDGSKVLVTTRSETIADTWLEGSSKEMYKLRPLPPDKAFELFCKKTFRNSSGTCPPDLDDFARRLVPKCGGLPPAIISLARLLSSKKNDISEWEKVCDNLGVYLSENLQLSGIHKTFMQDYYALPYHLKPCLLYFGMFPAGVPVCRMRLIRLWIAEGFVCDRKENCLTLEETAEGYIDELIKTSFIEVKSRDGSGKVKRLGLLCEFFHEMIRSKLEELSFCKILSEDSKTDDGHEMMLRRLFIQIMNEGDRNSTESLILENIRKGETVFHVSEKDNRNASDFLDSITNSKSSLRSVIVTDAPAKITSKLFVHEFFKSISLLRVLDLFNAAVDVIPEELGTLHNLRYLGLRCTRVSTLPSSIGKLENLQTLDLKQTFITELPTDVVNKLTKLRHLLGYYYEHDIKFSRHFLKINGMKLAEGLSLEQCSDLQELAYIDLDVLQRGSRVGSQLRNLSQLRKLGIMGLKSDDGLDLCCIIDEMKHLLSLNVYSKNSEEVIDLTHVNSPPRLLKQLTLNGPLPSIPTWVYELHGLVKLRLRWSNLHADPFETLQLFPNLVELELVEAYNGDQMEIATHGFRKLKTLRLLDLYRLELLSIAKGALPVLEDLSIGESEHLEVPCDVQCIDSLKTLNFYGMPARFVDQIRVGKPLHSIVKHVGRVFVHEKYPNGWRTSPL